MLSTGVGPSMGEEDPASRTNQFLLKCSEGAVSESRLPVFRNAMNCARCHDGETTTKLNFPFGNFFKPTEPRLIRFSIEHGHMPKKMASPLSVPEREALYKCLVDEYFGSEQRPQGLLQSWLTGPSCANKSDVNSMSSQQTVK